MWNHEGACHPGGRAWCPSPRPLHPQLRGEIIHQNCPNLVLQPPAEFWVLQFSGLWPCWPEAGHPGGARAPSQGRCQGKQTGREPPRQLGCSRSVKGPSRLMEEANQSQELSEKPVTLLPIDVVFSRRRSRRAGSGSRRGGGAQSQRLAGTHSESAGRAWEPRPSAQRRLREGEEEGKGTRGPHTSSA